MLLRPFFEREEILLCESVLSPYANHAVESKVRGFAILDEFCAYLLRKQGVVRYQAAFMSWEIPVIHHTTATQPDRVPSQRGVVGLRAAYSYGQSLPEAAISPSRRPIWAAPPELYVPLPLQLTPRTRYQ